MNAPHGSPGAEPNRSHAVLVLFAVRDEARHFTPPPGVACEVVVSGMGKANAERALRRMLDLAFPQLVLTCGYAGGLNPELQLGDVVFETDPSGRLAELLLKHGAKPGRFHCADRVVTTAMEKQALWQLTGADAVEMESGVVREICARRNIPTATVRVISDAVNQDLPLDFNELSGPDGNIRWWGLARALMRSPELVPKLMRFQRELARSGVALGSVLEKVVAEAVQGVP
jgi:adenosylhomocysteine nucleosidase